MTRPHVFTTLHALALFILVTYISAKESDILWQYDAKIDTFAGAVLSPDGGRLYIAGTSREGSKPGIIKGFNAKTGTAIFTKLFSGLTIGTKLVMDANGIFLYVNPNNQKVYKINLSTGEIAWEFEASEIISGEILLDYLTENVLYFSDHGPESKVYAVNAVSGAEIWSNVYSLDSPTQIGQNHETGEIYYMDGFVLNVVSRTDGLVAWTKTLDAAYAWVVGARTTVLLSDVATGKITALRATNGELLWTSSTPKSTIWEPATVHYGTDSIFVGDMGGQLSHLDLTHGTNTWSKLIAPTFIRAGSVISSTGVLYTGTDDGKIYAIDAATGDLRWGYPTTSGTIYGTPALNNDGTIVYGINHVGKLFAFKTDKYADITTTVSSNTTGTDGDTNSSLTTNTPSATTKSSTFVEKNTLFIVSVSLLGCAIAAATIVAVRMY